MASETNRLRASRTRFLASSSERPYVWHPRTFGTVAIHVPLSSRSNRTVYFTGASPSRDTPRCLVQSVATCQAGGCCRRGAEQWWSISRTGLEHASRVGGLQHIRASGSRRSTSLPVHVIRRGEGGRFLRGGPMSCEADEMRVVTPVPGGHSTAARQFASRFHRSLIAGRDKVGCPSVPSRSVHQHTAWGVFIQGLRQLAGYRACVPFPPGHAIVMRNALSSRASTS